MQARIAIIGDYNPAVKAHQGIPRALELSGEAGSCRWEWLHTTTISDAPEEELAGFHGIWCAPASPYANTRGALAAIRYARETGTVFLGTCGGFQHALLEYAQAVWGVANAAHAEMDPGAADPVIAPLACSLVEKAGEVRFEPGSFLATVYGALSATEEYHCSYGLSEKYSSRLASGPLRVAARDAAGDVRAVELDSHPFFIATLFQPERSGLAEHRHPLVSAFVTAARGLA